MIRIEKGKEPASLTEFRAGGGRSWDDYDSKADANMALCQEQRAVCAYCMGRIEPTRNEMHVEHWVPRSARLGQKDVWSFVWLERELTEVAWPNLLGVCRGQSGAHRHCDVAKADRLLSRHPARDDVERGLRYRLDGEVTSDDERLCSDLKTLNLNCPPLRQGRAAVIDALRRKLGPDETWTAGALRRELKVAEAPGQRMPYAGIAVWFLRRQLQRRDQR